MTVTIKYGDTEIIVPGRTLYYMCLCFAQICGIISFFLLVYGLHRAGDINWDINSRFYIHPLLMLLGMVYLQGTSISAFRALNPIKKQYVKYFHASVHTVIFVLTVIALSAVFDAKNAAKGPHLVTFHAWVGFITVLLFTAQWVFSAMAFLYPKASLDIRRMILPLHRACGLISFSLAITSALTGFTKLDVALPLETAAYDVWLPMLVMLFGIVTVITVVHKNFKRDNKHDWS